MTTSAELVARVRANINEPSTTVDPLRLDEEIAQWVQDGQMDYIQKIPGDAVPEMVAETTPTGANWTIPTDFLRLIVCNVNHTISGTVTLTEEASIISSDDTYMTLYYPGGMGAWAQFREAVLAFGPNAYGATIRYFRLPTNLNDPCATLDLGEEHEEPICNYATSKALAKVNDRDAAAYMAKYDSRVAAEQGRYPIPLRVEKAPPRRER